MAENTIVFASEIAEYIYCKRGWWLRLNNLLETTPEMQEGSKKHSALAATLSRFEKLKTIGMYILLLLMLVIALYLAYLVFLAE